jgi:hypothetical protein
MYIYTFCLEWPIIWPPRIFTFPPGAPCITYKYNWVINWKGRGGKRSWSNRNYPVFCLEGLKKTMKIHRLYSRSSGRDINPGCPEYEELDHETELIVSSWCASCCVSQEQERLSSAVTTTMLYRIFIQLLYYMFWSIKDHHQVETHERYKNHSYFPIWIHIGVHLWTLVV